jgi:hypothetical protein
VDKARQRRTLLQSKKANNPECQDWPVSLEDGSTASNGQVEDKR